MCGPLALGWRLAEEALQQGVERVQRKEFPNSEQGTVPNFQEHCILRVGSPTASPFSTSSRVPFPVPTPRPNTSTLHT